MKYLITSILIFFSLIVNCQSELSNLNPKWIQISGDNITEVSFDEIESKLPTPIFYGDVDSLCLEMEKLFVEQLNKWRRNHGIPELEYDVHMERVLTNPHNKWQLKNDTVSHGEDDRSLHEIAKSVGLRGVGECVAFNYRRDINGVSEFLNQYMGSVDHWNVLTNKNYHYISISVLYNKEKNKYFSTVNVRW